MRGPTKLLLVDVGGGEEGEGESQVASQECLPLGAGGRGASGRDRQPSQLLPQHGVDVNRQGVYVQSCRREREDETSIFQLLPTSFGHFLQSNIKKTASLLQLEPNNFVSEANRRGFAEAEL